MPIFDKELMGSTIGNTDLPTPKPVLGSPTPTKVNTGGFNAPETGSTGLSVDQLSNLAKTPSGPATFNSPFQAVPKSELLANQRYPMYQRNADLENIYGLQQGWTSQLANGVVKMAATGIGTFAQSLSNIPNTISAIKNGEIKDLSGNPDGYEGSIDNWLKNIEDKFPNYYTRYEQQHPFLAAIPGFTGSGNFWGDKFIKNIGFTIGAIGGAVAQDAALGMMTEGIGEIPLVANQVGKASLWLNKLFTGSNDLDKVLELGSALGKTEKQLLNIQKLGELAAATKVANGFRYGMGVIGSAQTEAAVEGRDGYNQVKKELTNQYKLSHLGEDPTGADAKQIEDYATSAMNTRFGINMGLLTVSNAIQFDNLFKSIGNATKGVTSGLTKELEDAGKIGLKEGSLDVFEAKLPTKLSEKVWDAVRPKVANIFAEGVYEEGGQYAAERGTYDYYTRKYKNLNDPVNKKNWNDLQEVLKSTSYGLGEQFGTTEGWENMFIGGLTAVATGWAEHKIDKIRGVGGADARLNSSINILNQYGLTGVLSNKFDNTLDSVGIAKDMKAAADKGDVFQYKNLQHNMFFNFVQSRIPSGMHDVTIEQLGMLKDLSKEDFEKTFGMDFNASNKQTVNQYVDGLITEANNIKKTTDSINNTFKNPFKQVADHKDNDEQRLENAKFNIFEKWKTDLAFYATVAPNINNRLESIQQDVANINPAISNDLLGKLTNKTSLEELAKSYEDTAANLNKSIIDGMTADEKRAIKDQVKAYRTQSEKINLAINDKNLDDKTFESLLNFELNGQLPVKDKLVGSEHIADLYNFGHDINRANALKQRASDIYDDLSTKNGFDKYFDQAEKMAEQEVPEEKVAVETPVAEGPQFTNKEGDKEAIELNKEYQIPDSKQAKIDKIDDNRWQVTAPNGDVTFHNTEEKAQAAADDLNKDFKDLAKVKVLAINSDGTIKVEDKNGDIQNIDADQLAGYERIQTKQEQLLKNKEQIEKAQEEIESKSGDVATGDNITDFNAVLAEEAKQSYEDKKKPANKLFTASKTESEDWENPTDSLPHITRSREFLNNVQFFPNRQYIGAILVTVNNAKALGLDGIAELSYRDRDKSDIANVETGFVAQVYVQSKNGKTRFVGVDGKTIGNLGGPIDLQKVVFQTMPTTELTGINKKTGEPYNLFRDGEEELAKAYQKGYIDLRQELFADTTGSPKFYNIDISNGIAELDTTETKDVNGKTVVTPNRNHVKGALIPANQEGIDADQIIRTTKGLVQISIKGEIVHKGKTIKFPPGRPVFQLGDTIQFLNNNKFTQTQANTVYSVIKALVDDMKKQADSKKPIVINRNYAAFLQNVLYWRKSNETSTNQIYIDTNTMDIYLGGKQYDITTIEDKKDEIIEGLRNSYMSINNSSLTENFNEKFREYYLNDEDKLVSRKWANYQSYLLSDKLPSKEARSIDETPLSTPISKASDAVPYSFKQRYSSLVGLEFAKPETPEAPKQQAPAPAGPTGPTVGGFAMHSGIVNTYTQFQNGPVKFTGTVDDKGDYTVDVESNDPTAKSIATNASLVATIKESLDKSGIEVPTEALDAVRLFLSNRIIADLKTKEVTQEATPATLAAPVVSDIEAKPIVTKIGPGTSVKINTSDRSFNIDLKTFKQSGDTIELSYVNGSNVQVGYRGKVKEGLFYPTESYNPNSGWKPLSTATFISIELPTVSTESQSIEAKKADIEKRRKQEIEGENEISIPSTLSKEEQERLRKKYADETNAKYDAELAILEGSKPETSTSFENAPTPDDEYRKMGVADKDRMTEQDLTIFKQWAAEKLPGVSYEALENMITTFTGEKAWGVAQNGIAKFVRGGLRGTEYHEVGEVVWKAFLSPDEQKALIAEFKATKGTFTDRETGNKIDYNQATDRQAKERILDNFSDFRVGKLPARSLGERVLRFFRDILNFFKSFVAKPSLQQELFKAIEAGKYKNYVVLDSVKLDTTPEYRKVGTFSEQQTNEMIQDLTARAAQIMFGKTSGDKVNIYSFPKITSSEVFSQIANQKDMVAKRTLMSDDMWNELVKRTKESLRSLLGVKFNDENVGDKNDEESNSRDYARDPFTIGSSDSSFAIKLAYGTLPLTVPTNGESVKGTELPKRKFSDSVKGNLIIPFEKVYSTLINKLANTSGIPAIISKFAETAKADSDFVRAFNRFGGNHDGFTVDFSTFKPEDWRFFIDTLQTFVKQKPNVTVQYVNGDKVYLGAADLYTSVDTQQREWIQNMRDLAKEKDSIIKLDLPTKTYTVDKKTISEMPIDLVEDKLTFLNSIGINFTMDSYLKLSKKEQNKDFPELVSDIHTYLQKTNKLATITGDTLNIEGKLNALAAMYVRATNPIQDSTYTGVDGKRRGAFAQNNALSLFANTFNESATLTELKKKLPQLNDVYSTSSLLLKLGGDYFDEDGNRIKELVVGVATGENNSNTGKGVTTNKLSKGAKFSQELNHNFDGIFYAINPADSNQEWNMKFGNYVSFSDISSGDAWEESIFPTFKGYLQDEVALALDFKNREKLHNVGDKGKDLRFFKDILSSKVLEEINQKIASGTSQADINKYIEENSDAVNTSVKNYLEKEATDLLELLKDKKQLERSGKETVKFAKLSSTFADKKNVGINKNKLTFKDMNDLTTFAAVNYVMNNMEYHKVLLGDPYQFAIKEKNGKTILDETKRVKSFLSGRETTFNSDEFNNYHNTEYNKTGSVGDENRIQLEAPNEELGTPSDPGYSEFKDYLNTVTLKDIDIVGSLLKDTNEADAASIIIDTAYRQVKLRNSKWDNATAEPWHQWQMAYTRQALDKKGDWSYGKNEALRAHDAALVATPEPKYVTEILKPIVTGVKYNSQSIDQVLDKTSQMPLYYKAVENTTNADLYIKMWKEGKDYVIVESGRKVGAEKLHELYKDGKLNTEPFNNNIQVSWNAYGIQVETTYDEAGGEGSTGSQLTKVASVNLFDNGKPINDKAEQQYKRNTDILRKLISYGYDSFLNKMGVIDLGKTGGFKIIDKKKLANSLEYEMLRREVSQNTKDTLQLDENGEWRVPFEASSSYIQIRDIVYSMINKSIVSRKTNGGGYVQAPVTGWENSAKGRKVVEINGKKVLTDDTLKFYTGEDGKRYCEIMLPHWFKKQIGKNPKFNTDKKILDHLNGSPEGRAILEGVGFRIPTQALSSVEAFVVKGFLDPMMGKTVVVPSEITTKAGSDFDIDKLNLYLKSIYIDSKNDIRLISYKGSEKATRDFYAAEFDKKLQASKNNMDQLLQDVVFTEEDQDENGNDAGDQIIEGLKRLNNTSLQAELKKIFVENMYKKSLQNEYYESLREMITNEDNFKHLITPVDDNGLSKIAAKLDGLKGEDESTIKNRLLNRIFLTNLRHAFTTAKSWVGIVAVNITGHSLAQKGPIYLDPTRIDSKFGTSDGKFLGNGDIYLPHLKATINGETYITISAVKDYNGKYISNKLSGYATAVVDVAKDPYFLKIIKSQLAISTALFLERATVPTEFVASFLNQPIISQYLDYLDNIEAASVFGYRNIETIKRSFPTSKKELADAEKNIDMFKDLAKLDNNISTYATNKKLDTKGNAEQIVILNEFLKYSKMADFASKLNEAMNYDTTKFRSGDILYKKQLRTQAALDSNIFKGVDNVMKNTFIGDLAETLDNAAEATGEVFILESEPFRNITDKILNTYASNQYLKATDYDRIANKVKASFLDYIIQTRTGLNADIKSLVADLNTSVADQLAKAKKDHPNVKMLDYLKVHGNARVNSPRTVTLKANPKNAANDDYMTGLMREMRDNPATNALYKDIVKATILQGIYKSPISINNIIPIEDYSATIKPIIENLKPNIELEGFAKGAFEKNNWKSDDIFKQVTPAFVKRSEIPMEMVNQFGDHIADIFEYASPDYFPHFPDSNFNSSDRRILQLNEKDHYVETKSDYIKIPRIVDELEEGIKTGERIDILTGQSVPDAIIRQRRISGDTTDKDVIGYKKVYDSDGYPVITEDAKGNTIYVYKLINLLGDGNITSEYYLDNRPSVLDNGTIQISTEIPDADIEQLYYGKREIVEAALPPKSDRVVDYPQFTEISPVDDLITWNLGTYEGTPQTKQAQEEIDQILINTPDQPVAGGESFTTFSTRILDKAKQVIATGTPNSVILTHNAAFGLIKLWDKQGRPDDLSIDFRTEYTKQDSKTGDFYKIKGDNGDIYVIRHGETTDNLAKNFRKSEAELTPKGIQEALETGKALKNTPISQIVASSLPRTVHTANLIMSQQEKKDVSLRKEKSYTPGKLKAMDSKKIYKDVSSMAPATDARGLALEYFANGGKISPETLYNEVISKKDSRLTLDKKYAESEIKNRDYVEKGGASIKEIAHFIWENLNEELQSRIDDQDIRNELIDVIGNHNKRLDVAKEYLNKYKDQQDDEDKKEGLCPGQGGLSF